MKNAKDVLLFVFAFCIVLLLLFPRGKDSAVSAELQRVNAELESAERELQIANERAVSLEEQLRQVRASFEGAFKSSSAIGGNIANLERADNEIGCAITAIDKILNRAGGESESP